MLIWASLSWEVSSSSSSPQELQLWGLGAPSQGPWGAAGVGEACSVQVKLLEVDRAAVGGFVHMLYHTGFFIFKESALGRFFHRVAMSGCLFVPFPCDFFSRPLIGPQVT